MPVISNKYRPYFVLAIVYATILIAYHGTINDLFQKWIKWDESQSHGLVIIALSVYLYLKRFNPVFFTNRINSVACAGILFLSFVWALSAAISINIIEQLCLFLMLFMVQFLLFGYKNSRQLLGPIGLLIFAIPLWDYLSPSLVTAASFMVTRMLSLNHMTAYIEGNSIFMPYGTILIADGCSGLRYLVIALALASYVILTSSISYFRSVLFLLIAAALGLIVNWLRIYLLVIIAYLSEMQSGLIDDHETFGWLLFIIVLIPLVFITNRLPFYSINKQNSHIAKTIYLKPAIVAILCLATGPALYAFQSVNISRPELANKIIDIDLTDTNLSEVKYSATGRGNENFYQSYLMLREGTEVLFHVSMYWQSHIGDPLVPYIHGMYNRNNWKVNNSENINIGNKTPAKVLILEHKFTGEVRAQLYWFRIGRFSTNSYIHAKLLQFPAMLTRNNLFVIFRIESACLELDCDIALRNLIDGGNILLGKI